MIDLKGQRLLICEEALRDYNGHFYSWIKAIREINIHAGAEVLIAGNKDVNPDIKNEFSVYPVYTHNNWSGIYDYKQSWRRYTAVFLHNYRIYRQTRNLLRNTGPVDCILLPAVRIHHLLAWKKLCKQRLGKDFKRVILFILTSEAIYDEHSDKPIRISTNFYREIAYNLEHTIHHMALIRVGISEVSNIRLPEDFGIATSTVKHRKQCAQ